MNGIVHDEHMYLFTAQLRRNNNRQLELYVQAETALQGRTADQRLLERTRAEIPLWAN